jgi:transcriptional regulator with XRE-family HTH domain
MSGLEKSSRPRLLTIAEATLEFWGSDTRSLRNRTRDFLKVNEIELLRDGKQYYVRATDLNRLVSGKEEIVRQRTFNGFGDNKTADNPPIEDKSTKRPRASKTKVKFPTQRTNRIKILAAEHNLTIAELARKSGLGPHNLRRYVRQEAQPRLEVAMKIAASLSVSVEDVLGANLGSAVVQPHVSDMATIPLYGAVPGNSGQGVIDLSVAMDQIVAPHWLANAKNAYALIVPDNSIEPRFLNGEILFVHPGLPPKPGNDVVIHFDYGAKSSYAAIVRFISQNDTTIVCQNFSSKGNIKLLRSNISAVNCITGTKIN